MQYLTKSFHTKSKDQKVNNNITESDIKYCIKKLNKWLAKSDQQDVKVDDLNFVTEWNDDPNDSYCYYSVGYHTKLVIIYHHINEVPLLNQLSFTTMNS